MKFCPKCGRQLADGEVCTCQTQPANSAAQAGGQEQMNGQAPFGGQQQMNGQAPFGGQQQMNGQAPFGGQQQFNGQAQFGGQPQMRPQPQTDPMVKELADLFKGIVKTPAEAITKYVKNASIMAPCILIAVLAFISGIKELLRMLVANMQSKYYTYYKAGDIVSGTIGEVVTVILSAALIALLIMVIINAIEKDNKVTYAQALAIASLGDLLYIPLAFIGTIFAMIPVKFFSYLSSWIKSFGTAVGYIYTFFGIRAVEKKDNHMPLVYGCAALAAAVLSTVISLIF